MNFSKFPKDACVTLSTLFLPCNCLYRLSFFNVLKYESYNRFQDISLSLDVSFSVPNPSFILSFDLLLFHVYTVLFQETPRSGFYLPVGESFK